ncbi:hypothetical protein IPJ72_01975 [Candidatus Peregrinibacteria bacterium]|nr:MAG: hypothetical protein IPJ72_01975 [Candidatus Peregrinibacteria bacterium]
MKHSKIDLVAHTTLLIAIGLVVGYGAGFARAQRMNFPDIKWVNDVNEGVTTLQLITAKQGVLKGVIAGNRSGRIAYQPEKIIEIAAGESFEIPLNEIDNPIINLKEIIPDWAQFAASKQGKYYYSVLEPSVLNLSETNRLFFATAQDAEQAGFTRK